MPQGSVRRIEWKQSLFAVMRQDTVIRSVAWSFAIVCLVVSAKYCVNWLGDIPLTLSRSKASIGLLNVESAGAELRVNFVPPKKLESITIQFQKPMRGSGEFCAHPDFPLALRVRVAEPGGTNITDEVITKDRMQWTSWHAGPSLLLMTQDLLGKHLSSDRECLLTLSVETPVADLGQVQVFLHWMDTRYLWRQEVQKLELRKRVIE